MANRSRGLLAQIEAGALNSRSDLADLLRKCLALGGQSGSTELRDWARRELDGYKGAPEDLPPYRLVTAGIAVDGANLRARWIGHQISTWELPEFARADFDRGCEIPFGVGELQRLARKTETIKLQMSGMQDLVYFMNHSREYAGGIHSMYFQVSPTSIHGILETIRTNLVALVAEIRAGGVDSSGVPTPAVADQAFQVVIKGRARATFNTAINHGIAEQTVVAAKDSASASEPDLPSWLRAPWAIAVGVTGIAGGVAGVAAWAGWNPFT